MIRTADTKVYVCLYRHHVMPLKAILPYCGKAFCHTKLFCGKASYTTTSWMVLAIFYIRIFQYLHHTTPHISWDIRDFTVCLEYFPTLNTSQNYWQIYIFREKSEGGTKNILLFQGFIKPKHKSFKTVCITG